MEGIKKITSAQIDKDCAFQCNILFNQVREVNEDAQELALNMYQLMKTANEKEEFYELADKFREFKKMIPHDGDFWAPMKMMSLMGTLKSLYNNIVGYGLPSREVCERVLATYSGHRANHPNARLIDFGAGSGVFAKIFADMGIDVVAYDLVSPTHQSLRQFHASVSDVVIRADDVLFISWGINGSKAVKEFINRYIKSGGKCIMILGEGIGGCTFPFDFFNNSRYWACDYERVPTTAYDGSDYLSANLIR